MNTAPNRRASDNASSLPGTSPTRRFSDMLKEGSSGRKVVANSSAPLFNLNGDETTAILCDFNPEVESLIIKADKEFPSYTPLVYCFYELYPAKDPDTLSADYYTVEKPVLGIHGYFAYEASMQELVLLPSDTKLIQGTNDGR